jgi:hypothetical protein
MKHHFLGRARDGHGNIQINQQIFIYFTGTTSAAPVYQNYEDITPISIAPQISTNIEGLFSFYVDDTEIEYTQLFDIVCQEITYERIDIFKGNLLFNPKQWFLL